MTTTPKGGTQAAEPKRGPGRPVTGKALTNAERQARFRAWKKIQAANELKSAEVACDRLADDVLADWMLKAAEFPEAGKAAWLEMGRRRGWLK